MSCRFYRIDLDESGPSGTVDWFGYRSCVYAFLWPGKDGIEINELDLTARVVAPVVCR